MIARVLLAGLLVAQIPAQQPRDLRAAWMIVTSDAFVDVQVQDAKGRISGMDLRTGHPLQDLPNSVYDPDEGISDDETGEPDPHPVQDLEIEIRTPGDYILRLRSSRKTAASVNVDFLDRQWQSVRRTIPIQPGQIAQILEYRVHVDPMAAKACALRAVVRRNP